MTVKMSLTEMVFQLAVEQAYRETWLAEECFQAMRRGENPTQLVARALRLEAPS